MTVTRLIPGVLPEDIDNRKESAESLSSISEAKKNDHTYSMYEQSGTCMEEFGCQTRLCLKCRRIQFFPGSTLFAMFFANKVVINKL